MFPDKQMAIEISRMKLSTMMPLNFPYFMKEPESRAPVIAPRLVIDVIAVVQYYSSSIVQPKFAANVLSRFPHEASPIPNWYIPMQITNECTKT